MPGKFVLLICLTLCIRPCLAASGFSELVSNPVNKDSLIIGLEKRIFLSQEPGEKNILLLQKAELQLLSDRPVDALYTLERVETPLAHDSLLARFVFATSLAHYVLGDLTSSADILDHFYLLTDAENLEANTYHLRALTAAAEGDTAAIRRMILKMTNHSPLHFKEELLMELNAMGQLKRISPRKASLLSLLLPGLGQAYAGSVPEGFGNFLLVGGMAASGVGLILHGFYISGIVGVLPIYLKLHGGSRKRAARLAELRNRKWMTQRFEFYRDLIRKAEAIRVQ